MSGDGKNIIVQADHPTLSWQQLLAHEELHRRIKGDDAYRRSVQDALLADENLKPYLSRILDRYTEAYRAVKPGITDEEIVEELLADYRAGFDMLDPLGLQDRNTAKAAKAAAKDIRAVERKAEKSGENNPLLESQQDERYSIDFRGQDTETKRREARRQFQQKFTGKSIPTGKVTLTASDHAFLKSELKSGNGTLASDGESGYISNVNYGYYFMLNRDGDALIYRKIDADDLYKINHVTEVLYGSGKDASPADSSLQGGRSEYGYGEGDGGQPVRRNGYAGNDQLDGEEQSDRRRSATDVSENRAPIDRINPVSKTSYHSELDDLMYDFSTNDGRTYKNDVGASDAEIEAEANEGKASREVDPDTLDMLNNQDLVTVYRAMQVVDGKLYPPMAAKVSENGGKAQWVEPTEFDTWYRSDERPELIDAKGKFKLDKGNGKSLTAAYNPYFHTSNMMLNDQFSSAWDRDNLVVVEASIPKSELTSGYRAEGAKDPVGEMNWHSGPVASKLKGDKARRVTLSRWVKINRIVPNAEVAQSIANLLDGENISVPENTVTPSLKAELEKLGVQISPATGNAAKGRGSTSIEIDPEVAAQFSPQAIAERETRRSGRTGGKKKVSKVRSNTYEYSGLYNEVEAQMSEADEENFTYDPISEKKSMNEALGRLRKDFDGEVSRLSEADRQWGGSDLDTAMGILHRYRTEGRATGDYSRFWDWSKTIQEKGTKGGQFIQAFAKYTRTGTPSLFPAVEMHPGMCYNTLKNDSSAGPAPRTRRR